MFCLYWDAKLKKVHSLNGSGRAPMNTTIEQIRKELDVPFGQIGSIPLLSALAATVPGAAAGWCDTIEKFGSGKLTMEQILTPAIELGEKGFPVSQLSATFVSSICLPFCSELIVNSGKVTKTIFETHLRTLGRCYAGILAPRTLSEHLERARSCKIQRWPRPFEPLQPRVKRASTLVA